MNDFLDITETATRLGKTERHIRRMCLEGKLRGAVKDGSDWRIPLAADARLSCCAGKAEEADQLLDVPAKKRNEALTRLGLVQEAEKYCSLAVREGRPRTAALDEFAAAKGVPIRTLQRWTAAYKDGGLIGLVDNRGRSKFRSERISPEAFELFKSMYLSQQQLSLKSCWQNIRYVNNTQQLGWKIPSLSYMHRLVDELIPLPARVLHREGLAAYEAQCAPYIQKDPDSVEPGAVWIGDHSQFNCWVRHRGNWVRPWITAWQDMRSRAIVGIHISASPNQTTIMLAMKRGIEKYGPPDSVKIDNGKDYDSELFTGTTKERRKAVRKGYIDEHFVAGLYAMMNIGISFSIPYHPQSKAIERFFDTLDVQFTKTFDTYCGKDTQRKPEDLAELLKNERQIAEAYSLEQFAELVNSYIDVYNNSAHGGAGMEQRTPLEVLNTRQYTRTLQTGVLDLLMRVWSGEIVVGKNGVRFKGIWYGQYDERLLMAQGQKVRVAYDPDDMRNVHIYDATTLTLITIAEQNQLVSYGKAVNEEALREATKQKARAVKITRQFRDSRLTANTDLTTLTLNAMRESARPAPASRPARLRPVITPLNEQVQSVRKLEIIKEVRKAAGGEAITRVLGLDIDVDMLRQNDKGIKLFDD
ncbi:MAG: transposase domain-containing protein [Dehalococcoidales bacterium]|jgi:transposase InsO family protein|nr:Mu transposase C-terminal domain-containing protein [Candidatus Neomarinimicrobiota bacterium]